MSLRLATLEDIDAMHRVRIAVRENRLSDPANIKPEHYRSMLAEHGRGWVYEVDKEIVAFAIADHCRRNIWALFVKPEYEGRGIGRTLHDRMVAWLFEQGVGPLWLNTAPSSRAEHFDVAAGWQRRGVEESGELRFELMRKVGN